MHALIKVLIRVAPKRRRIIELHNNVIKMRLFADDLCHPLALNNYIPNPGMRILVTLLLDTLPMLGNVLLLCFFVFFIFGK